MVSQQTRNPREPAHLLGLLLSLLPRLLSRLRIIHLLALCPAGGRQVLSRRSGVHDTAEKNSGRTQVSTVRGPSSATCRTSYLRSDGQRYTRLTLHSWVRTDTQNHELKS